MNFIQSHIFFFNCISQKSYFLVQSSNSFLCFFDQFPRVSSSSSLTSVYSNSTFVQIWKVVLLLTQDPHHKVKDLAQTLVNAINLKVCC